MADEEQEKQKREYFRIVYPHKNRATLKIENSVYPIQDISQKGIRFSFDGIDEIFDWEDRMIVKGEVTFLLGDQFRIVGKVLRVLESNEVVLFLRDDIPLKSMNDEHRHIIKNFGSKE